MGQSSSQPERQQDGGGRLSRRVSMLRQSVFMPSIDEGQQDRLLSGQQSHGRRTPRLRTRPGSVHRLSQLMHFDSGDRADEDADDNQRPRASGMLQRTRSTIRDMLGRRESTIHVRSPVTLRSTLSFPQQHSSYMRTGMNSDGDDYYPPRLPSIDLSSTFDNDAFSSSQADPEHPMPRSSSSNRRSTLRLDSLRPNRSLRHYTPFRRRRQSPPPIRRMGTAAEDQAAMLSRLLSVAAAATAATLMGDDHHALTEATSLSGSTGIGDIGASGEDGSFDGFLRALQNGRIASALRGGGSDVDSDTSSSTQGPLNFFRMFRFGASAAQGAREANAGAQSIEEMENGAEGRMVPIIIVGIRSISPSNGSTSGSATEDLPPFIDALNSFPSPLPAHALGAHGHDSIDTILRPPQNGTRFSHRRRASMGNFGMSRGRISDRMDDQRDHRSPDRRRDRPWSVASSSSALEPRPPPATPASPSPELSRISSRNTTPSHSRRASLVANSVRDLAGDSRRNSTLHRASTTSPLSSHTEETISLHSTHSSTNLLTTSSEPEPYRLHAHRRSDTAPNIHYPRFASGHPRRNGMVEPIDTETLPSLSRTSTTDSIENSGNERSSNSNGDSRSWIIYVLGGSYPENHPILTTPSLFTENPTYEDMMLLSALLGPAKAPVATEEDVENAGGLFTIVISEADLPHDSSDATKTAALVAEAVDNAELRIPLEPGQRCPVCLCDFEIKDAARNLVKCQHLFHQECIDQWLTQGRNSCPLCRGQGVDEKEKSEESTTPPSTSPSVEEADASAGASNGMTEAPQMIESS